MRGRGMGRAWRAWRAWLGAGLLLAGVGCFREPSDSDHGHAENLKLYSLPLGMSTFCRDGAWSKVGLDSDTDLGFTAASILEFAEGEKTQRRVVPVDTDSDDPTTLIVEVESLADGARMFDPVQGVIGHGLRCDPWLEIEARVTVKTSDGALDTRFDATLFAVHSDVAIVYARPDGLDLQLVLSPHGVSARLWEDATPDFGDTEPTQRYAAPDCARSTDADFSLPLDASHRGTSAQRLLDRMQLASALDVLWDDGTSTAATARFEGAAEHGCLVVDNWVPGDTELSVAARVALVTDDGRFDGILPGIINAGIQPDVSESQYFWIDTDAVAAAGTKAIGFTEYVDRTELDLDLWCSVYVDPADVVSGDLSLSQRPENFCGDPEQTDAAEPCSADLTLLESATLTGR